MNFEEAIKLGKSRSDCSSSNLDTVSEIIIRDKNILGNIAELGSYRCGNTISMAASALQTNPTNPKVVYAFDMFGGVPYDTPQPFDHFGNVDFEEISLVCNQFPNIILVKGPHEKTVPNFESEPLSLIYLDSDYYSSHKVCLEHLWPMLSPGGSIIFHDWAFEEVQQAINEYFEDKRDQCEYFGRLTGESQNLGLIRKNR